MSARTFFFRLIAGTILVIVLLVIAFAILIPAIHTWGATDTEVAQPMPGDELIGNPAVSWTHAITIDARLAQVWPWIAQIGDTRAGFYSYTFIENRFVALMAGSDAAENYKVTYVNADRIHPEWQNPTPGTQIIQGGMQVREVKTGEYLLADAVDPDAMGVAGWVWVWALYPQDGGERTRLVIRMRILLPEAAAGNPVIGFMMDAGGFVMEQKMMQGIKLRAEGGSEPAYSEAVEIFLWLFTLSCGLVAGWFFLTRKRWTFPLSAGIDALIFLFIITFVQPAIWLRLVLDLFLVGSLLMANRMSGAEKKENDFQTSV
jgi:hypothetical protein